MERGGGVLQEEGGGSGWYEVCDHIVRVCGCGCAGVGVLYLVTC